MSNIRIRKSRGEGEPDIKMLSAKEQEKIKKEEKRKENYG